MVSEMLNLNPAIWEAIAGTGEREFSDDSSVCGSLGFGPGGFNRADMGRSVLCPYIC